MIINKDTKGYYFVTDYRFGGDYFTNVKKRMTKQDYENTKNFKEWADYATFVKSRI